MSGEATKHGAATSTARPRDSSVVARSRQSSVLLVDPDRAARTPVAHLLSERYAVWEAEDGLMALRLAAMLPDLAAVIAEVRLPSLDGPDLLKIWKAHARLRAIPFVFLTSAASPNDALRLRAAGASDVVPKRLASRTVVRTIARLVSG
jgi:CheY-like chemotaxis protein